MRSLSFTRGEGMIDGLLGHPSVEGRGVLLLVNGLVDDQRRRHLRLVSDTKRCTSL